MFPRTIFFMLACAAVGYLLGRSRSMGLQGFFLGLAFGPIGWGLILLWPRSWIQGPVPRDGEAGYRGRPRANMRPDMRQDPRSRAESAPGGGSCPRCGNVLVPIRYRVNPGGS